MKKRLFTGLMSAWLGVAGYAQTLPLYENAGYLEGVPNIDATAFVNSGTFVVYSSDTYYTYNTVNYTNTIGGLMYAAYGFGFAFETNGFELPANSFHNGGVIQSYGVEVAATNVLSAGFIDSLDRNLLKITGKNVNLSRGTFRSDASGSPVTVYNTLGTKTYYVGCGTNDVMEGEALTTGTVDISNIAMPFRGSSVHDVMYPGGSIMSSMVPLRGYSSDYVAYAYTNQVNPSNLLVQVLFINTNLNDTNMTLKAGFVPAGRGSARAVVQWGLSDKDIIDDEYFTNYLTFVDNTPAFNSNYIVFSRTTGDMDRPASYTIYQGRTTIYPNSSITTNAEFDNTLIVPTPEANTIVTNTYAAWYGAVGLDTVADTTPSGIVEINPALYDPTNVASRVEIYANDLDISNARIRAGAMLKVTATNLVSNAGCKLDAPVMRWDVGNTNGYLAVSNFMPANITRIVGTLQAYSEIWTNGMDVAGVDDTGAATTNTITVIGHALYVSHNLEGKRQVQIYDAAFHSTNVVIFDDLYITKSINIDADGFLNAATLSGQAIVDCNWAKFSRIKHFTNSGAIDMGTNLFYLVRTNPVSHLINSGLIDAAGEKINAQSFVNSGTINANYGSTLITANQAKLDGGTITSVGDIRIAATDLKVRQATLFGSMLYFNVTNSLTDGGPVEIGSQNNWQCFAGLYLPILPKESDLRGTRILCYADKNRSITNYWAGKNYGAMAAGFTNNAALGALILDGKENSQFAFQGYGTNTYVTNAGVVTEIPANAIYVDYLDFRDYATNVDLAFGSNIVLYFAASSLPAEELDGKFNGHLRWVRGYAGPASLTTVYLKNGQSISVNANLLNSSTADSNGNGTVNSEDPYPFDFQILSVAAAQNPTNGLTLTWNGAAQTIYYVDYATSVDATAWTQYQMVTNSATTNKVISTNVPKTSGNAARYYRVRYNP